MRPGETLIEMARRHVAEGEAHVRKQWEIIDRLAAHGLPTDEALQLLHEFEATLLDHWASVARIEEEQRRGRRDASGIIISGS